MIKHTNSYLIRKEMQYRNVKVYELADRAKMNVHYINYLLNWDAVPDRVRDIMIMTIRDIAEHRIEEREEILSAPKPYYNGSLSEALKKEKPHNSAV